jgi:hypothetical protein
MTARFSVKNSHIEYDLILVFKKQTPTVKVITVRLRFGDKGDVGKCLWAKEIATVRKAFLTKESV